MKKLPKYVSRDLRVLRAALRKQTESQKKLKLDLACLKRRVEQLEKDTSPHRLAGYY